MKIPFAVSIQSGKLVEIGMTRSGRACQCVCPSCEQSVLARKGNLNEWHFSHDPDAEHAPKRSCEISFFSCCRRFIIELAERGVFTHLLTPELIVSIKNSSYPNKNAVARRSGREVLLSGLKKGAQYDLEASIGEHHIDIHLDYPSRGGYVVPVSGERGLLVIDLSFVAIGYKENTSSDSMLANLVIELFTKIDLFKRWAFHPKAKELKSSLEASLIEKKDTRPKPLLQETGTSNNKTTGSVSAEPPSFSKTHGAYYCQKCCIQWPSKIDEKTTCQQCQSNAHTRFWPRPE